MPQIAVIDYGSGNIGSVTKAIKAVGGNVRVTSSPIGLERVGKIVLPGVGSFSNCIQGLKKKRLLLPLIKNIKKGKYYLGLCLGMQILFSISFEEGRHRGLNIFSGEVIRFSGDLKVPQIGWNRLNIKKLNCPIFKNLSRSPWMYFVHSYYVRCDEGIISATTQYGSEFPSAIWEDHIFGLQFHPEKSQDEGLRILKNFVTLK